MTEPRNYRDEAARIRAVAAAKDDEAKTQLMKIADLYDRLADLAETQAAVAVGRAERSGEFRYLERSRR
ncbi:MAG: hypothetical protein JWL84_4918 [Rhodospirillales bacterium]|jgi:hypothetical protein|nr:hypothetical protein [Rhodospirillales bacterium]